MTASGAVGKTIRETIGESVVKDPVRLYYLDWIRLLATLGVFVYHASRPFIQGGMAMIQNDTRSIILSLFFLVFLGSWGMPLFFFVSGTSSLFALRKRSGRQYAMERLQRLFLPFVAGTILFSSFQFYLEWLHKGWYEGPYLPFIPILIRDRLELISQRVSPNIFVNLGSHLWFLGFLLAFSLLALPLFLWFKGQLGQRVLLQLGRLGEVRGGLLVFVVPIVLSRVLLQGRFPSYTDWADFSYMFLFFVLGYVLYADERFKEAIWRDGKLAFWVGLAATAIMFLALAFGVEPQSVETPGTTAFYLAWTLASVNGWCWTIAALSFGMRSLQTRNKWLDTGQELILPFYVFHHPFILIVAFYVVEWPVVRAAKWLIIIVASFLITLGFCHFVIGQFRLTRAIFGMKTAG
ncbi:MAG: acyltransferase family protein [Candidatus Promineifilaceae bacterium]